MPGPTRNRRLGAPAAFNPRNYGAGTLRGWFRAGSISLNDGDAISTWPDSSGLGNDATNAGGIRPVYKTSILNGKPAVLFTRASSQYLIANGIAAAASGSDLPVTAVMVIQPVTLSTGVTHVFAGWGTSALANPRFWFYSNNGQYNVIRRDDAATQLTGSVAGETTSPQVLTYRFSGTACQIYRDGTALASAMALDVGTITLDRFTIGANLQAAVAANFYDGYVMDMVIYAADLSTGDRSAVERGLAAPYNLTVA